MKFESLVSIINQLPSRLAEKKPLKAKVYHPPFMPVSILILTALAGYLSSNPNAKFTYPESSISKVSPIALESSTDYS